ncbi:hypothetical protein F2Q69_00013669 [Brassica cretica]|uniref:Uncharacterized protein n=1 Tax=Brassica cretica TaxID=69181 RepID=A0A8S9R5Z4_BRACR|nr:hypothetical protein F2Q69_00013669 [Brassica cretica]
MYDCLVFQEGAFIEEGNFVEKWFFRRLRRLAMLKIYFSFVCRVFVLEMFAGLKMFRDIAGVTLNPAFEEHSCLSTDVRSLNCSCLDANNLICDREGAFIEEGNFVEKWFFRRLRRLAMLKIYFSFVCRVFVLEMFAGLKMFRDIAGVTLNPAFEEHSCLSTDDVFTQIAKDVVGQGLDHGSFVLTFRCSLRGLIQNKCGVACGMTAFSDVAEGKERQKKASRKAKK